jgi:hypothetical protein
VIVDVTGKKVLTFDAKNEVDQRVSKAIAVACDETMKGSNRDMYRPEAIVASSANQKE